MTQDKATLQKAGRSKSGISLTSKFYRHIFTGFLLGSIALFFGKPGYAQGTWVPLANTAPHYNHGVMLLLPDGTVLAKTSSGDTDVYGNVWDKLTPDIHGSYINGTWSSIAPMNQSRLYFSSQVLKDGRVYVAGGEYGSGRTKGEIYDPLHDTWTQISLPVSTDTLSDANSEILDNGKVIQAVVISAGELSQHTYLFDPKTNTYSSGPDTRGYDNESAWVKLPGNSILFMDIYATTSERYIPATNTWAADAAVPVDLYDPFGFEEGAAFMLPDGRAFFIGSTSNTEYYTPSGTMSHGTWTVGPHIPDSLGAPDAAAAMMVDGNILCAFAHTPISDTNVFLSPMSFYEFNYITNSFTQISAPDGLDSINSPAYFSNMLCLPDGSVLYSSQGNDQYYEYVPGSIPLYEGRPVIDSIIKLSSGCDTFMAIGKLFNGITEGAGYRDDWQMATNYPIVRLITNDTVYNARTYNWTSTGVMRGSLADTTEFVLPGGLPDETYYLQVVANGNPSDFFPFNPCSIPKVDSNVNLNVNSIPLNEGIHVYPNPASKQVTVAFYSKSNGLYNIKLTDVYGRVVIEKNVNEFVGGNMSLLDPEGLQNGIYTIVLSDPTGVYNVKLIVQ